MHRQLDGTPVAKRLAATRGKVWISCAAMPCRLLFAPRPACRQTSLFLTQYLRPSLDLARQAGVRPEVALGCPIMLT